MPFNVQNFKAGLNKHQGISRASNFRVLFSGQILQNNGIKALAMLCHSTVLPGRGINGNPVRTHGPSRINPSMLIYDDISMTFYCTNNDLFPKPLFEEWQDSIIESTTGTVNYPNNYTTDIEIEEYNDHGDVIYSAKLIDAFPILVAPSTVDWGQGSTPQTMTVTFNYRKYFQQPLTSGIFSNYLKTNGLFPNFDLGGILDSAKVAAVNGSGGQVITSFERGRVFANSVRAVIADTGLNI